MSTDPNRRSTSNSNSRGSSYQRRAHRQWLVQEFRADVDIIIVHDPIGDLTVRPNNRWEYDSMIRRLRPGSRNIFSGMSYELVTVCRCWRCGKLLTAEEVSPDRWPIAGVDGGRYVKGNTRPSCEACNTKVGSALGHARKAAKRATKAARAVRVALPPGAAWRSSAGDRHRHVVLAPHDRPARTLCGKSTAFWDKKKTRCPECVAASA